MIPRVILSGQSDRVARDARVRMRDDVVMGGSPWRLSRLKGPAASLMRRARRSPGAVTPAAEERIAVRALVDRGLVHPCPDPRPGPHDVTVVIPAYGACPGLAALLSDLSDLAVIVVDDGTPVPSPVARAARASGARYVRLSYNQGPAAARNAGIAQATTDLVALVDADCRPEGGWLDRLVPFFDDERVALVAPRVVAEKAGISALERYEASSSALDMGARPALVRPGAALGFVPSAAMLARRAVLKETDFDQSLRLGEDVDLVWRLADAGWHVRYEPTARVSHASRGSWTAWARRRFEYGTSAVALESRHPGRLAPVQVSPWNVGVLLLLASGHPYAAAGVLAAAAARLDRSLRRSGLPRALVPWVLSAAAAGDAAAIGHVLRREYWPLGFTALVAAPRSRAARLGVVLMLTPIALEWVRERPALDPVRYAVIRLMADAAYGAGVLAACVQAGRIGPVLPRWRQARPMPAGGASATT